MTKSEWRMTSDKVERVETPRSTPDVCFCGRMTQEFWAIGYRVCELRQRQVGDGAVLSYFYSVDLRQVGGAVRELNDDAARGIGRRREGFPDRLVFPAGGLKDVEVRQDASAVDVHIELAFAGGGEVRFRKQQSNGVGVTRGQAGNGVGRGI
jgi:hypothetical protein